MPATSPLAAELREQAASLQALTMRLLDANAAGLQLVLIVHDKAGNRVIGEAIDATNEVIRELDKVRGRLLGIAHRSSDHDGS